MIARLLVRFLEPRSYCAGCRRPWFSDQRQPCGDCGETSRLFMPRIRDALNAKEATRARRR